MELFITNRLAFVHRMEHGVTCTAGRNAKERKPVTPLQCLVFKLPHCDAPVCFPHGDGYGRLIGRRAS